MQARFRVRQIRVNVLVQLHFTFLHFPMFVGGKCREARLQKLPTSSVVSGACRSDVVAATCEGCISQRVFVGARYGLARERSSPVRYRCCGGSIASTRLIASEVSEFFIITIRSHDVHADVHYRYSRGANYDRSDTVLLVVYSNFRRRTGLSLTVSKIVQAVLMLKTTFFAYTTCIWPWIWSSCR